MAERARLRQSIEAGLLQMALGSDREPDHRELDRMCTRRLNATPVGDAKIVYSAPRSAFYLDDRLAFVQGSPGRR